MREANIFLYQIIFYLQIENIFIELLDYFHLLSIRNFSIASINNLVVLVGKEHITLFLMLYYQLLVLNAIMFEYPEGES